MVALNKNQLIVFGSILLALAVVFAVNPDFLTGAFGIQAITSARLSYSNSTTASLIYDNFSNKHF